MAEKLLLGEILKQQNLVSQDTIDTALRVQVSGNRRLGQILVKMRAITADQLAEILAEQLDTPVINIDDKFSPEVKKIVPRCLCQQYGVIPLAVKGNNILEVAMANPSDEEAIVDLERYTDKVVEPFLALDSDINREIRRKIPLSSKDFFTPKNFTITTRAVATVALILVCVLGYSTYHNIQKTRYGTVSATDSHVLYENHDLILGVDKAGKVSLLGHGAFSRGYYSVSFDSIEVLQAFLSNKEKDFSKKQREWLDWAVIQIDSSNLRNSLVAAK